MLSTTLRVLLLVLGYATRSVDADDQINDPANLLGLKVAFVDWQGLYLSSDPYGGGGFLALTSTKSEKTAWLIQASTTYSGYYTFKSRQTAQYLTANGAGVEGFNTGQGDTSAEGAHWAINAVVDKILTYYVRSHLDGSLLKSVDGT